MPVVFAIVIMWFNTALSQLYMNTKSKLLFWWKLGWIIWKDKAFIDKGALLEEKYGIQLGMMKKWKVLKV